MNNIFFGILCTFLGAAIGGLVTISSGQTQKTMTNLLFAATGGVASAWAGYGLGRWQNGQNKKGTLNEFSHGDTKIAQEPIFRITYPHFDVKNKDRVEGSYEQLPEKKESGVWLYVHDGSLFFPYKIREIDRIQKHWKVENIAFGEANEQDDGKFYDIQVLLASQEASNQLLAGKQGLRELPESVQHISEKVTLKRVFF
jgi:hypothetical protein